MNKGKKNGMEKSKEEKRKKKGVKMRKGREKVCATLNPPVVD
jgi:hypothetical protein